MSIDELINRVDSCWEAADRAFRRLMNGEVSTSAAAVRLQRKAQEAEADVRFHPDYDFDKHGAF